MHDCNWTVARIRDFVNDIVKVRRDRCGNVLYRVWGSFHDFNFAAFQELLKESVNFRLNRALSSPPFGNMKPVPPVNFTPLVLVVAENS